MEEEEDPALVLEMERLAKFIEALELTHGNLLSQLQEAKQGAQEVSRKVSPGKRGHDGDDDDGGEAGWLTSGVQSMGMSGAAGTAVCSEVSMERSSSRSSSGLGRAKRRVLAGSQNSLASTDMDEVGDDTTPAYRSAFGFSTPTTGEEAAGEAGAAAADDDEFDDVDFGDGDGPPVTYRSCALGAADVLDDDFAAAACAGEGRAADVAALRDAVAAIGALAEPGVLGATPSDAVVSAQLDEVLAAMRALLK